MSDRTFKYRQLGRRDPATSAEMYARDSAGNSVPLITTPDGKLIVEGGGGGGGGGGGIIQGKDELGVAHDVRVDEDGRLVTSLVALDPLLAPTSLRVDADASLLVTPKDNAPVTLVAYDNSDPVVLAATPIGELKVVAEQGVQSLLSYDGDPVFAAGSSAGDAYVAIRDGVTFPVAIEQSITVPVEVQGVAEVKATSANWWAIGRGLGPVIVPGLSDSEGWIDVRPFSRISATGIGQTYTYDLADGFVLRSGTVHKVTSYAELTSAITAATDGDTIYLMNGVYEVPFGTSGAGTLTINKSLRLIGESREGVIIQTPEQNSGTDALRVFQILTITANNVEIRNLTLHHRQTVASSAGSESCISVNAGVVGTLIDTCKILYMEFGVTVRGQFTIRSCDFEYASTAPVSNPTYRTIGIYGITADSEITDVTAKFISTNTPRFAWLGSVTGTTYTGTLTIARCRQVGGYVHQWVEIQTLPGDIGAFDLVMVDNVFQAFGAGIIFSGTGSTDVLRSVTLKDNQMANAPKGMLGFDGARTTPLLVFATGNTATAPTLAAAYDSIYEGFLVAARNTVSSQYVVVGTDEIPELGIPAETGSSTLIYADTTVALEYRVTRNEPYTDQIAAHKLHTAHRHIVPPLEPKDILGVGFVRFNATNLHSDPGGSFAIFGVAK
jgi:hypothetical protein